MNNNTTSQYMDKQIMDLSNSQSSATANNNNNNSSNPDFIDFMNRPAEKKEEIVPSYEFMPIRPAVGSSSPKAMRSASFDSDNDEAPLRTWNSLDAKTNSSPIRNYSTLDADEPAKFVLGKNHKATSVPPDGTLVSDIERMMRKYMDNLMHAIDNMSSRLSQLESRNRNLEHSIDDLKVSVGNNHGAVDGKMRLLENILTEVQSGIKVVRDKQEIVEAQLQLSKLQLPHVEQVETKASAHPVPDPTHTGMPAHQQFSGVSLTQPPPAVPPPNAPLPPPQQNLQPQVQLPNQFPQEQIPPVPHRDTYFPPPSQTPENQSQQYQIPPPQQPQHSAPPPPQHQYPPPPPHQYPPPPQPQYSQPPPPSQPHSSHSPGNPSLPLPPMGHHPEETLHIPPQAYSMSTRPAPSHPSAGAPSPPSQQYYGPPANAYEPPPPRPSSSYSGSFGLSSGHGEPYPYTGSPSQYGSGSPVKQQQLSSGMGQSGGSGYPQLPTARILPQALPTASAVGAGPGSGSGGSGNRVPIDDVVDRVTNMGFSREQVRATVRKLTENGQSVDLNVVLDKLMNDGEGQAGRSWPFGR